MDLLALLAVGAVVAIPVALVGGLIAWGINVQKKRVETWGRVAAKLGLGQAGTQLWGTLEGQSVQLRTETRGSGKNKSTWTVAQSFLQPPLDVGLAVYKQGFLSNTFGVLFGAQDVSVGDATFDPAFVVKGDEPHRAAAILSPQVRALLLQMQQNSISINDVGGHIECRGASSDERWLEWAVTTVAIAARLMHEGRAAVPPATPLVPHRAAWMDFARAAGLSGMDTPLCLWGRMEDASISAYAVRSAALQYRLEVLVRFDSPLGLGLLVRPTGTFDGIAAFFGGQDHALGDAAFDGAFVVKAPRPDRIGTVLDPEVRRRLLEIASRGASVQVRDDGVTVRSGSFPANPAEVPKLVAEAKALARAIFLNATRHDVASAAPYR